MSLHYCKIGKIKSSATSIMQTKVLENRIKNIGEDKRKVKLSIRTPKTF